MKFLKNNPTMAGALQGNKNMITNSMTSTLRADDVNRPLHRPTTPMSNMSLTGTSQIYKEKVTGNYNNNKENQIEYDNKEKVSEDSKRAFMKKDKIKRTQPRNYGK